ncbi:MAG: DUF1559 domain-containing protein [Bryobacteraceae bacterium]|nr:DUF1559 domain-containing protein [Bryobacteraceae bacterium]
MNVQWKATPGAAEGRAQMFVTLRGAVATTIVDLLVSPASAEDRDSLARNVAAAVGRPTALYDAFNAWKGVDGKVALRSFHPGGVNALLGDGSVRFIRDSISYNVWNAMQVGVYGEKWETVPGIELSAVNLKAPGTQAPMGIELQEVLVSSYSVGGHGGELRRLLAEIKAASDRGDQAAVRAKVVEFQTRVKQFELAPLPLVSPLGSQTLRGIANVYQYIDAGH